MSGRPECRTRDHPLLDRRLLTPIISFPPERQRRKKAGILTRLLKSILRNIGLLAVLHTQITYGTDTTDNHKGTCDDEPRAQTAMVNKQQQQHCSSAQTPAKVS